MIRHSVLVLVFGLFLLANVPVAAFDIDVDGNGERDALKAAGLVNFTSDPGRATRVKLVGG